MSKQFVDTYIHMCLFGGVCTCVETRGNICNNYQANAAKW